METIKTCPECGCLAHWNSHFQAFICSSPKCRWMEKKSKLEQLKEMVNNREQEKNQWQDTHSRDLERLANTPIRI